MSSVSAPDNRPLEAYCRTLDLAGEGPWRVLFIQIPQVILDCFNRDIALDRGYYNFPPTGLQCLYEVIKNRNLEIEILDLNCELLKRIHGDPDFQPDHWPAILEENLKAFRPDIVGVSCLFDQGIAPMIETMRIVRERTDAMVIAGGVIATYEWRSLLERGLCHFVVEGEGENKLNFLLDHLTGENKGWTPTPGIHFGDSNELWETAGPPDVVEVKGNLIESYRLVPIQEYYKYGSLNPFSRREHVARAPFAALQLSRGCRAQCTFCAVRDFNGKGVRSRPVEHIIEEMAFLIEELGVRHFELLDDDPTFYRRQFQELLRAVIERGWDIRWSANNGMIAASIDEETMGLIRDSGCIGFKIGIETGNPDMLRAVKKPATHGKFLKFSKMIEAYSEVFVGGNFIVGLPEERFFQMVDSFKFILDVNLDWAAITACQVLRGASAFSDSGEYFEEQMKTGTVANFIPTRKSKHGHIETASRVRRGLDVFRIDPMSVPDADQVKEIWFTFNLLGNYIFNKNLMEGGKPEKFISWVETVRRAWPTNPYMSLFLSLAYVITGGREKAAKLRRQTRLNSDDDYWRERFSSFGLQAILDADPQTPEAVHGLIADARTQVLSSFEDWLAVDYGCLPDGTREQLSA